MAIGELIHGPIRHDAVNDLVGKLRPEAFRGPRTKSPRSAPTRDASLFLAR